jgi:hypothetical protein
MLVDVVYLKEWRGVHVKAACTSINLSSGSSCLSPSSLLPHLRNQRTTHKCLPFSPAIPPTFLTWPRCDVTGIKVHTVWAGYHYYTFQKHRLIPLHFLRNDSAGRSLLLYIPKTSIYFHYFSQTCSFCEYYG